MLNFIIGAIAMGTLWFVANHVKAKGLKIAWWQWLLTIFGIAFAAFVLASVVILIDEGASRAALVIGGIFGLIAVIWGVIMGRFVFLRKS